jgi:predicted GIY-YIG superfamily endonuclease
MADHVLHIRDGELELSPNKLTLATADLRQRLADHNTGKCPHTSMLLPWKIKLYVAFETIEQAQTFEQYLKSGSGHAFAKRHFWNLAAKPNRKLIAGNSTKCTERSLINFFRCV